MISKFLLLLVAGISAAKSIEKNSEKVAIEDRDFRICKLGVCHNTTRKVLLFHQCPEIICLKNSCDFRGYDDCPLCDCGDGMATSKSCQVQQDCKDPLICRDNVCTYENVPKDLPYVYIFTKT